MDRKDLTAVQWARHHNEEMADGLKYGIRMEGSLVLLEQARGLLGNMPHSPEVAEWIKRHDLFFPSPPKI